MLAHLEKKNPQFSIETLFFFLMIERKSSDNIKALKKKRKRKRSQDPNKYIYAGKVRKLVKKKMRL